jgi:RES domain
MRISGCNALSLHPLTGSWFRALNLKFWKDRLSTDHTKTWRSRFSDPASNSSPFRVLYLGENHQIAIYEVGALLGDPAAPVSNPKGSWALMSLQLRLHGVADLCEPDQQKLISTNDQELTGIWANDSVAPTQELGAALYALPGAEGAIVPSSKGRGRNLVVFMDKLDKRSVISYYNDVDGLKEFLV